MVPSDSSTRPNIVRIKRVEHHVTAGEFGLVYRGNVQMSEVHFGPSKYMYFPPQ
jgi:hypothetical protein